MRIRPLMIRAMIAFTAMFMVAPAGAATLSGLEGLGKPVSDQALGGMRGKFVAPSGITYFGIVMSSSWQGSDGITTAATLLFSVNFGADGKSATPELLVSWSRDCGDCGDDSMDVSSFGQSASNGYVALGSNGAVVPIGSLGSVTGVVHSQQIAGSDNQSHNVMSIEIVPSASLSYDTTGMSPLGAHGQTQQFDDGDMLRFTNNGHQLGLTITDQSGALQQSINSDVGQLAQHVLIDGNGIVANNSIDLMVGFNPNAAMNSLSVQNALSVMKGMNY
jgi:hypothetical protein